MEDSIQFIANYGDWKAIKKLAVVEGMQPRTVMEFLAGLATSLDAKVEENLRKEVDLSRLDSVLEEGLEGIGKSEADIAKALRTVNSRNVSSIIREISEKEELQKNEKKELAQFCKTYATRKALKACKLPFDYSEINIPGMKRTKTGNSKRLAYCTNDCSDLSWQSPVLVFCSSMALLEGRGKQKLFPCRVDNFCVCTDRRIEGRDCKAKAFAEEC